MNNRRHAAVPPKIGFGRRNLFLQRHAETVHRHEHHLRQLKAALEARTEELGAAQARIREMERAHDERHAEGEALRRVGEAMGSLFDLQEMLNAVAGVAVQMTGTDSSQVYLFNGARDTLVLRAAAGEDGEELVGKVQLKVGEGLAGWVAQHKEAAAVGRDAYHDARFKFIPELHEDKYESMLSVPLVYRSDVIGVINVRTTKAHEYTQTQVRLLQSIASQIAGAIENSRQYRKLEKRASQLSTLSEVSKTLTGDLYLEEILQLIVAATAKTMAFKICALMLLDEDKQELVIKATQSTSKDYARKPNVKMGESIAGRALAEGRTITVADVKQSPEYASPEIARKEG
ncbi:MAG: GAF domain-containing protein, partial [Armatimonadetes bacterium]|nr:GAF domain-containing protein [Armatimonadota bacterium]